MRGPIGIGDIVFELVLLEPPGELRLWGAIVPCRGFSSMLPFVLS